MRYLGEDIAYFVRTSPYLALAKPKGAVAFLRPRVEAAEECRSVLHAYPDVRVEPLDFFYTCLHSLGALDQAFFEALLVDHTWRGVVWGAWLSMLAPERAFADPLRAAGPKWPENRWLVDCALSTIEGRAASPEHEAVVALAARARRCLEGVPRPGVSLRAEPTKAEIAQMARERERIALIYANMGTDAALRALRGTLVAFHAQDYVRWARSCAPAGDGPRPSSASGRG